MFLFIGHLYGTLTCGTGTDIVPVSPLPHAFFSVFYKLQPPATTWPWGKLGIRISLTGKFFFRIAVSQKLRLAVGIPYVTEFLAPFAT